MNVFLSKCKHLPESDRKRPDITSVAVLAVEEALHRQPLHRDVCRGLNRTFVAVNINLKIS